MKAILSVLMVLGFNVANAASAVLCENEVTIQAVQKVMESIDAESKSIAGMAIVAEKPVSALAGIADAKGISVDVYVTSVSVSTSAGTVTYKAQLSVEFDNAKGTCDYVKGTTTLAIQ